VPQKTSLKKHVNDSLPQLSAYLQEFCAPILKLLPLKILPEEDRKNVSLLILIQALSRYTDLTDIDAIDEALHDMPEDRKRPAQPAIIPALNAAERILRETYAKTQSSCLVRCFGATKLEVIATCTTITAYGTPFIDFTADNFVDNNTMDVILVVIFAALFLISAILKSWIKLPEDLIKDYGYAPSLRESMTGLVRNPFFLTKTSCAIIFTILYFVMGALSSNNPTADYAIVSFFIVSQYLAIATGIDASLSLIRTFAEYYLRAKQAQGNFYTSGFTNPRIRGPIFYTSNSSTTPLLSAPEHAVAHAPRIPLPIDLPLPAGAGAASLPLAAAALRPGAVASFSPSV
jgi:hypothetical protein